MNETELKKLHEYEMIILDEIVDFCKKNKITYFLAGGSALGAIRHKGFIPWDDDIDIAMTRKDYNYLINNYKDNDKFYLQCIERDKNYWNMFAKMRMKHTFMEEKQLAHLDVPKEIFVDIFPIDNAPSGGYKKIMIKSNLVKINSSALLLKFNAKKLRDCNFKLIEKIVSFLPKGFIYSLTKRIMTSYKDDNSEYVVSYLSAYAIKNEYLPRTTYFEPLKCKFEDREYKIPKETDKYLTRVYGNYMTLPPIEKRVTHRVGRICFDTRKDNNEKDSVSSK